MSYRKPRTLDVARAIGRVTFREVIRDKILYNIILCAVLLFSISFLASRLTFVRPERVVLDFGLSAVNISCAMIAIFTGSSLIGREFDRRTIYVALSHPISRAQFVLGKFAGIAAVIVLNWALLSVAYLGILRLSAGPESGLFALSLFSALFLVLLQSLVISSLAILFSTFSTTSLSAIFSIGMYLVGNNISEIRAVALKTRSPLGKYFFNTLASVLPNLENFNLGSKVTYGLPVSGAFMLTSTVYGIVLVSLFLLFAGLLIRGREV
jgi:Cu-processing system permease protein